MFQMLPTMPAGTLPNLEAFCRTYEAGSFSQAARLLSVTPQATSRSVARLEAALGVTLFRRTTRSLAPTVAGVRYYERCLQALAILWSAEQDLARSGRDLQGRVRVSVPTTYGHSRFLPALGAFRDRYPGLEVEVSISNHNVDFVKSGCDLAIRMGIIKDKTLVARKLGDFGLGVYGSASYLSRHPAPRTPGDLKQHVCIGFRLPSSGRVLPWVLFPGPQSFEPDARYCCAEDVVGALGMARGGVGLTQMYDMIAHEHVERGALVEVLAEHRGFTRPFSLVYPRGEKPAPAVRAMIDFIVAQRPSGAAARAASQPRA
jgi:DNA-binding transcriptional LysR family regulator